jgi:RNA polymerase sigma-70 factor (ECF subfamily)
MTEPDDKALVQRCLDGDPEAFAVLIDRYQRVLFNVSLRMLNNPEDARDATQTAFVKAYEKLDTFNPKYKFFSWIYKIMVNESLNQLARRRPHEEVDERMPSEEKTPEDRFETTQVEENVQRAVVELPLDYRRLVVLRHFGNLSYRDMSGALDLPEKTVKSRLYTARQMLRDILLKQGVVHT